MKHRPVNFGQLESQNVYPVTEAELDLLVSNQRSNHASIVFVCLTILVASVYSFLSVDSGQDVQLIQQVSIAIGSIAFASGLFNYLAWNKKRKGQAKLEAKIRKRIQQNETNTSREGVVQYFDSRPFGKKRKAMPDELYAKIRDHDFPVTS